MRGSAMLGDAARAAYEPVMLIRPLIALLCALFACGAAFGADRVSTEHAETRLVPVRDGFAPGETTWFALAQELEEGWHVYWKNPGDSGLPLDFVWTLPEGYSAGAPEYPTPERIELGPLANYGHHGAPIFLIPVAAPENARIGDEVEIGLRATWLICEDICVPEEGAFSLSLPVRDAPEPSREGEALMRAGRAAQPGPLAGAAVFEARADALLLSAEAPDGDYRDAYFFPETEGLVEPAAPQAFAFEDGRAVLSMAPGVAYAPDGLSEATGVLVLTDATGARKGYALAALPSDAPLAAPAVAAQTGAPAPAQGGAPQNLALLIAAAFLGGIILNAMPCVFPIVFIKAATLLRDAHGHPGAARRGGALYGLGVLATFAALGGGLLALRAGGAELGWGFHLQSPAVVLVSAYVLFMVGLHLAGVFSVGESVQGVGGRLSERGGDAGAFFTGALAVFVAAPCIGPLLAAPVGAAVMMPPAAGMAIFLALGAGLAAPYVALSFAPGLGRMLPKPGPWMVVFKQTLAFPVFAAAAYFLWVLARQTGADGLGRALAGALLLAFGAWLFEKSKTGRSRGLILRLGAAVAVLAAFAPMADLRPVDRTAAATGGYGALAAEPYDAQRLASLRADGRGVFVDFTAAWCVTCQFNKLTVLSRPSIAAAFDARGVAFLVADWTSRDPAITAALAEFGASGVPLYVYYAPGEAPVVFPQPLTEGAILRAVANEPQRSASR